MFINFYRIFSGMEIKTYYFNFFKLNEPKFGKKTKIKTILIEKITVSSKSF
jgi:hypothetical protein